MHMQNVCLTPAISGGYDKYILNAVSKTAVPAQVQNKVDDKALEVTIPVDAGENDLIRGIQISLSQMRNIELTFYDDKENCYLIERETVCGVIDLLKIMEEGG